MKWITRERPKIDRIACPWLISRFIDKEPEFIYVPKDEVLSKSKELDATPYDVPGVEFTHEGEFCSFDKFIKKYELKDEGLDKLAFIVRAADTDKIESSPEAMGLYAISSGLSNNFKDDHEMLRHGMIMYDALYSWCRNKAG